MGAGGAGCGTPELSVLGGCQADRCLGCLSAEGGPPGLGALTNPCFCSDEEVEIRPIAGLDYKHFIDAWPPSRQRDPARPLYAPGSLVPLHGLERSAGSGGRTRLVLTDTYTLENRPIGRGAYGEVFAAIHKKTGARRAVKSVGKAGLRRYVDDVGAFVRREFDILRRLDHPNIIRVYEAFEDEDSIHLVLELCQGGDLLERLTSKNARMPEGDAAAVLLQMLAAVQHLCLRGVVHRDLKPENFLFTRREPEREPLPPEDATLKLIDFGLSRRLSTEMGTYTTPKIGTAEYMAPEAYAGKVNVALAHRADMWSIGVVLHILFIGHFPSAGLVDLPQHEYFSAPCWSRVSEDGVDLLKQLLRQEPVKRPAVTTAMRHPWLVLSVAGAAGSPQLMRFLSPAVRAFACAPPLRRLALAAVAREVGDEEVGCIRRFFQAMELECEGVLTRAALELAATRTGPAAVAASELASAFCTLDADGSDALDWTELLAVVLGACGAVGALAGARSAAGIPELREDTCWSAFDLLSQGSGVVSGVALGQLLARPEVGRWITDGGRDCGSHSQAPKVAELDRMVREVDPSGALNGSGFLRLIKGIDRKLPYQV